MVLIQDERPNRLQWPLGIVQKLYPGRDGLVRTVEVKTSKGVLVRPVQKIHMLELSTSVSDKSVSDEIVTRGGRVVRTPRRLDM